MSESEMVTIKLPKSDVEALLNIVDDIRFLQKAEEGMKEIKACNFVTLDEMMKKHNVA